MAYILLSEAEDYLLSLIHYDKLVNFKVISEDSVKIPEKTSKVSNNPFEISSSSLKPLGVIYIFELIWKR